MQPVDLGRKLVAEALGACLLVTAIVGSGIMAAALTGDGAIALLANSIATGAALVVLITILAPVSGAHFNPAVSLVSYLSGHMTSRDLAGYVAAQLAGGVAGTFAAHLMFSHPLFEVSPRARSGGALWFSEALATFGLVVVILAGRRFERRSVPWLVALYIVAAYWFTASTSFANPAVTIARAFTDTFAGIRPIDAPGFIAAQLAGAVAACMFCTWLLPKPLCREIGQR